MLGDGKIELLEHELPLFCLLVQILYIVLNVLEIFGIHHLQISILLELLRPCRPYIFQFGVNIPIALFDEVHAARSLSTRFQLFRPVIVLTLSFLLPLLGHFLRLQKIFIPL